MKPCFGYIRVSTTRQGDGASLEAQKDAITSFASQNNLNIIHWFEELETASKAGRPIFDGMLEQLKRGDAEGIVMHKIDRSARNYSDWARLHELANDGTKIYFAADSLNFDTRGGQLLADIQMALAADYSRNLSSEVKKGIYGRLKNGVYPFRAPLGYLDTGGGNLKAVDPIKGPLIRELFALYCSGEHSISSLTIEMQRRGLKSLGDKPIARRNVESVLRNPFYYGKILVRGQLYDGAHEPLITVAQFRQIGFIKAGRYVKKSTKNKFQFRNLFRCGYCDKVLTGERQKAHVYYRCHTRDCPNRTIREDRLCAQLEQQFAKLEIKKSKQEKLIADLHDWFDNSGQHELEKSLRLRIADLASKQDRLTDLLIAGTITQSDYERRKENHDFEIDQLREELAAIERSKTVERDLAEMVALACDLRNLFKVSGEEGRRKLVRNCIDRPEVKDGELIAQPKAWLEKLRSNQMPDPAKTQVPDFNFSTCGV